MSNQEITDILMFCVCLCCIVLFASNNKLGTRSDLENIEKQYHHLCQELEEREALYESDYKEWESIHKLLMNHINILNELLKQQKQNYDSVLTEQTEYVKQLQVEHRQVTDVRNAQDKELALLKQQQQQQEKEKQMTDEKQQQQQQQQKESEEKLMAEKRTMLIEGMIGTINTEKLQMDLDAIKKEVQQREDIWNFIFIQTRSKLESLLSQIKDPTSLEFSIPEQLKVIIQEQANTINSLQYLLYLFMHTYILHIYSVNETLQQERNQLKLEFDQLQQKYQQSAASNTVSSSSTSEKERLLQQIEGFLFVFFFFFKYLITYGGRSTFWNLKFLFLFLEHRIGSNKELKKLIETNAELLASSQSKANDYQRQIDELMRENQEKTQQIDSLKATQNTQDTKHTELVQALERVTTERENLLQELQKIKKESTNSNTTVVTTDPQDKSKIAELEAELNKMRETLQQSKDGKSELEKKYNALKEQNEKLVQSDHAKSQNLHTLLKEKDEYLAYLEDLKNKIRQLEKQVHDHSEKEQRYIKEIQELKKELAGKTEELTAMFSEEVQLKKKIEELKKEIDDLKKQLQRQYHKEQSKVNEATQKRLEVEEEKREPEKNSITESTGNQNEDTTNTDSWLWWLKDF
ncbi:viral A-type inclusion protein [Reticulomyxa filosa]|uniref:Viral A-type inclusion protein n=1 Tax=Reticulomyxa filosa TaxID=46433 RepID=X6NRQ1_RETFI|nr:viral A-type inclusion protein [Reticulomyxa filosa]|eukprot:ETO28623.1 viral A-type inclusion protein [Reticulomyxa filosa]